MISVEEALGHVFDLIAPLDAETVPLLDAHNRTLARPVRAARNQPPFRASAMDGYAVRSGRETYRVVGEAAAGHAFSGTLSAPDEAVRIFTGAPVPDACDRIVIQEDVERKDQHIVLRPNADKNQYIREIGADFKVGDEVSRRKLSPSDIALLAAMNIAEVEVVRRPRIALVATGDELVMPGEHPSTDQIVASNCFGLHAMLTQEGAEVRLLPIARDTVASLTQVLTLAGDADLVVTIGGASVGDHDLVAQAAETMGLVRAFYKVAMRPGKPLMAGRLGASALVGLPGNPVSAMVCGHIFLVPAVRAFLGLGKQPLARQNATLAAPLASNGPREHYMRALRSDDEVRAAERQDSALLSVLANANALIVRPPHDPPKAVGDTVEVIPTVNH